MSTKFETRYVETRPIEVRVHTPQRQAIVTRFHPRTDTKGPRVSARNQAKKITLAWDSELDTAENHAAACHALLIDCAWRGEWRGSATADSGSFAFVECGQLGRVPKSIVVIGKEWVDRGGHTWCTARVLIDGKIAHTTGEMHGSGGYYEQAAWAWIDTALAGQWPRKRRVGRYGSDEPAFRYCADLGINYFRQSIDVARKKDLD